MKKESPFRFRGSEQHHMLHFTAEGLRKQLEVLRRMASLGLNRACTCEPWPDCGVRLIDYAETLPEISSPQLVADARERRAIFEKMCAEAVRLGIEPWVTLNIVNYPDSFTEKFPDAIATPPPAADRWFRKGGPRGLSKQPQLCPSSAAFAKLVAAQIAEVCRLPHVGGVECWLTGADNDIFFCDCGTCRPKTMARMIAQFAATALPVCETHGKKLLLRVYLGGWRCALETEVWREANALIPPEVEICYKQQHGDLMTWHGPNPLAGQLLPHVEHVEFDLAGEYRGIIYGVVCSVRKQMAQLIRHYRNLGVPGIVCRGLDHAHPFDLDKWLFGALTLDPDLDVDAWSGAWARERYGDAAGDEVVAILDECAEIVFLSMYVRGVQWASWAVPHSLARLRFILFDRCAPCVPGSHERLQANEENICALVQEKQEALLRAERVVARCEKLRGELDEKFLAPLLASCRFLRAYVVAAGPLVESVFRFLKWEQTSSEVTREYARVPLLESLARSGAALQQAHGLIQKTGLAHLAALAGVPPDEKKFAEPFGNAETILSEIAARIDVEPSSWWSVYPWPERWPETLRGRAELYDN